MRKWIGSMIYWFINHVDDAVYNMKKKSQSRCRFNHGDIVENHRLQRNVMRY